MPRKRKPAETIEDAMEAEEVTEPDPRCPRCNGTGGDWYNQRINVNLGLTWRRCRCQHCGQCYDVKYTRGAEARRHLMI